MWVFFPHNGLVSSLEGGQQKPPLVSVMECTESAQSRMYVPDLFDDDGSR